MKRIAVEALEASIGRFLTPEERLHVALADALLALLEASISGARKAMRARRLDVAEAFSLSADWALRELGGQA